MSKYWVLVPLLVVYLSSLGRVGFLGPDEPRYASIGREMARSGDWVTPRLDGFPWFEKPPLLYWMAGAGHKLHRSFPGLDFPGIDSQGIDEWAARLPVALASLAFLWFFYRTLAREFSQRLALMATGILATSAGWVAYSFVSVTDLPMSAGLGAAMLLALFGPSAIPSLARRTRFLGASAGVFLGLAVLAKAFVPLVLIAPVLLIARRMRGAMLASCVVIAAPWLLWCTARHGSLFWDDFFWKQQVGRFLHPALEHVQPWWFYVPVILGALFPWTPLAALLFRRSLYEDERIRALMIWLLFGLVFFSAAQNKLPGYVLPLLPALAILLAFAVDKTPSAGWWIGGCAALLIAAPAIAALLPEALPAGITSSHFRFALLLRGWPFALAAGGVFWLARLGRKEQAAIAAVLASLAAVGYFKYAVLPLLDEQYSVRSFWRANASQIAEACVKDIPRAWVYGLNYYAGRPLPECASNALRIVVRDGRLQIQR